VGLEVLNQWEKSNYLIGNRNRDLPACSTVPQPTTLPRGRKFSRIKSNLYIKTTNLFSLWHTSFGHTHSLGVFVYVFRRIVLFPFSDRKKDRYSMGPIK
jgi:hypothetical protein